MRGILSQRLVEIHVRIEGAMFNLALKNLSQDKTRFLLGTLGVAFANLLVMFHMAMVIGTFSQITTYIKETRAEIWVLQDGLSDITSSTSFIPSSYVEKIAQMDGVEKVTGLFLYYTSLKIKSKVANVFLVGYDSESGIGGPWRVSAGKNVPEDRELIMDKGLAESEGLHVGDTVTVGGQEITIAGLSDETSAVATQYIFVPNSAVPTYLNLTNIYNYLLVSAKPNSDIPRIIEEINSLKGVNAYTKEQLARNTLKFWGKFLIPLLTALVFVSFLVGATIIGIVVYNITLHKEKEYGILLALGASAKSIYETVLYQGMILGASGFALGIVFSLLTIHIANREIPGMTARLDTRVMSISIAITFLMILGSTIVPLMRTLKIDPFEAFRR